MTVNNPFIYAGANELKSDEILKYYIPSDEYEKIASKKNIFVIGQRGSGKSMILKYHELKLQLMRDQNIPSVIGIYVPCNKPFYKKHEHMLLGKTFEQMVVSEHFLVLAIAKQLINTMYEYSEKLFTKKDLEIISDEINYLFGLECEPSNCLRIMKMYLKGEFRKMQEILLSKPEELKISALSFGTLVLPLIEMFVDCDRLNDCHFSFLIDDAHQLEELQMKTLNTWVSYRDNNFLSFKIAIAGKEEYLYHTELKNSIMENHDYLEILLEESMYGSKSDFNKFALDVVQKRLELIGIQNTSPEKYFAPDLKIIKTLNQLKDVYRKGKCPESVTRPPAFRNNNTNVNRYHRAIYFRQILSIQKANKPKAIYTGFPTITGIATGVIRNLLILCSKMYERDLEHFQRKSKTIPPQIRTVTQYESIIDLSKKKWMDLKTIDRRVSNCSKEDAKKIHNFFENFGDMLLQQILDPISTEKKTLSFFIVENQNSVKTIEEFERLFTIAKEDGYIYTRLGPDKSGGKTLWYTPNRLLWPSLGLDPMGENGRFSLGISTIKMMFSSKRYLSKNQEKNKNRTGDLFNVNY